MTFSPATLSAIGTLYLAGLFAIAKMAQHPAIPEHWFRHPLVYILTLGVFAGTWAINGVAGMAYSYGNLYLAYYLGAVAMFVFTPFFLIPVLRLCRLHKLYSLADLLAFRFRSQWIGTLTTIALLITLMPLLALQLDAMATSISLLAGQQAEPAPQSWLLFIIIALFAVLFGAHSPGDVRRRRGLVAAIAFESLIKLITLLTLATIAIFVVFGGTDGVQVWLSDNSKVLNQLYANTHGNGPRLLLLVFFTSTVALPHMFHMIFSENSEPRVLGTASWGMPTYLLLICLPILPLVWAAQALGSHFPPEYSLLALGVELGSVQYTAMAYVAGISAASATIIVSTLALANMCLNYIVLPVLLSRYVPPSESTGRDLHSWLRWMRGLLIICISTLGYLFFRYVEGRTTLIDLGMIAFIAAAQFLPGIIASTHWQPANRKGFTAGLIAGLGVWFIALLLPAVDSQALQEVVHLFIHNNASQVDGWSQVIGYSLGLNVSFFILVSLLTTTQPQEQLSAELCTTEDIDRQVRSTLQSSSVGEIRENLAASIGESNATEVIEKSLSELRLAWDEKRPYALRRLRRRIEVNISGLFGPGVAHDIVERCIPFQTVAQTLTHDMTDMERRLDNHTRQLTGIAADLDGLRRHYRDTLQSLPSGVFCLAEDGEILLWNKAMTEMTGVTGADILGTDLATLPQPWMALLTDFMAQNSLNQHKVRVDVSGQSPRWVNLHRSALDSMENGQHDEIIVVEDISDYQLLERELMHSERLASVGRMAAGVAHEIGNPITGIACLAQNLRDESESSGIADAATDILYQTERVSRIVNVLVSYSHGGSTKTSSVEVTAVSLRQCTTEAIHLLCLDNEARQVNFINDCNPDHYVAGDHQRLLQVLVNLLSNARDASDQGADIAVHSEPRGAEISIAVTDDGCGIPYHLQDQLFEPFFTTKDPGVGTGLGLSLVDSIVAELGGAIYCASPWKSGLSPGTRFTVLLPGCDQADW